MKMSKSMTYDQQQKRLSQIFVFPGFLLIMFVMIGVGLYSINLSFRDVELLNRSSAGSFVGFDTYRTVLEKEETLITIRNSLVWVLTGTSAVVLLGILTGYLLSDSSRIARLSRAFMLIPWVMPGVVVAGLWKWMYNTQNGLINEFFVSIGILDKGFPFLGTPETALIASSAVIIWRLFPMYALGISASIQSIDTSHYEAGRVDGMNTWQEFTFIILPHIKYQIMTMGITNLIWIMNNLVFINVMTKGGPLYYSEIIPVYMFKLGFQYGKLSQAAVVTVLNLLILGIFCTVYFFLYRKSQKSDQGGK
ncbi:MAG: sugar ABC transporter permease [Spirochaetia bacterium]|nr:sugar ABC transporter permease [Spirochaetia bacterium]